MSAYETGSACHLAAIIKEESEEAHRRGNNILYQRCQQILFETFSTVLEFSVQIVVVESQRYQRMDGGCYRGPSAGLCLKTSSNLVIVMFQTVPFIQSEKLRHENRVVLSLGNWERLLQSAVLTVSCKHLWGDCNHVTRSPGSCQQQGQRTFYYLTLGRAGHLRGVGSLWTLLQCLRTQKKGDCNPFPVSWSQCTHDPWRIHSWILGQYAKVLEVSTAPKINQENSRPVAKLWAWNYKRTYSTSFWLQVLCLLFARL